MKKTNWLQSLALLFLLLGACANQAIAQEDFEKWKENYLNEFEKFQNKYDKQFHKMLQKEWKEFATEQSPDFYDAPKPDVIPKANKDKSPKPETIIRLEPPKEPATKPKKKKTPRRKKQKPKIDQAEKIKVAEAAPVTSGLTATFTPGVKKAKVKSNSLTYFNIPIRYKYYAAYKKKVQRPIGSNSISSFWKHLSTKDYPSFLDQIQGVRNRLSLNDYGYAQLLHNIGKQIYGTGSPESTLFTWFMLTQSGFGTRVAYNNENVYLLIKTDPGVFRTSYFKINDSKYYALSLSSSSSNLPSKVYTYKGDYPKSQDQSLSLMFSKLPTLPEKRESRTFSFSYHDTSYTFELPVDQQVVTYFKDYPKAKLELYFHSRMDGEIHQELISSLRPLIVGKSNVEKANILLRFVQNAFEYQTDQEQFNTEKKMFPAEMLYYPASDCDDRSILFAYLIEHLTDLDYIVLRYPGHLTPALHFPSNPPEGSRVRPPIRHNGKGYYVSDPTYYNADAGMVMPKYQGSKPSEIFDL